jgi:hypothetical protein
LASELSFLNTTKYDASNPAGFINGATLAGYASLSGANFTGKVTIADGSGPPNLNIGSVLTIGYTLTPGDIWFENGSLNYIIGPSPETVASTLWTEQYVASAGFATESWVNSQGFATESWVNNQGFLTSYSAYFTFLSRGGNLSDLASLDQSRTNLGVYSTTEVDTQLQNYARKDGTTFTGKVIFGESTASQIVDVWGGIDILPVGSIDNIVLRMYPSGISFSSNLPNQGSCSVNVQGINIVNTAGGVTSIGIGATFQGRVITGSPTSAVAGLNIGSINSTSDLTNSVAGDVWMGTWQMTYKSANGTLVYGAATNRQNVFGAPQIIDTTATTAALRVTQKGTGNAIEVEDSTTPDATRFVVDQFGKVGVGTAPDATAAIKVDANGISFNGLSFNPTGTASHTGGSDTLDLLVTINGVNYRLGLRPA